MKGSRVQPLVTAVNQLTATFQALGSQPAVEVAGKGLGGNLVSSSGKQSGTAAAEPGDDQISA